MTKFRATHRAPIVELAILVPTPLCIVNSWVPQAVLGDRLLLFVCVFGPGRVLPKSQTVAGTDQPSGSNRLGLHLTESSRHTGPWAINTNTKDIHDCADYYV